jgi:hypothetical protein
MLQPNSGGLFYKLFSRLSFVAVLLLCITQPHAHAQSAGTASIQGTVADPTGAAVSNAKVTFTNTETSTTRTTISDGSGLYSLPNIPVGPYNLTVAATGFEGFLQKGVLEVGNNVQINPTLTIGSATEHIEVQAAGVALETETSSFKQVIDRQRITELPLNGRQATQLILVSGGAVNAPGNDINGSKTYANTPVIAVAGSQGIYNNYALDGGSHTDTFTNTNLPYPFPDALREFSVESNSLPARNGLHPGSLVNVVTNSGTNQWHGTVFDFVRNNIVNATNFFSTSKDTVKRNQFGGTLGGKVITDKVFFFGGYQGTREHKASSAVGYCLPTAAELNGDFSQMGTKATSNCAPNATNIVDPITGVNISATRKIAPSSISPQAIALSKLLPLSQADQFGRVNIALPANDTEDQYIGRIDYTLSQRHSIFGRYFLTNYYAPAYFSPTNLLLTTTAGNDERVQSFTLGDTFIITPKMVNTFHGTYARRRDNRGPTAGGINATTIGVNMYDYVPNDFRLTISNGFSVGCGTCSPGHFNTQTEDFSDDIDYVHGKHQFAFGGEILRTGDNTSAGYLQNGSFNFGGLASGVGGSAGEPMIDFIAGTMTSIGSATGFSQSKAQQTAYRQTSFGIYAQDTFHLNSRLTANIGLRWEPELFPVDNFHRGSTFSQAAFAAGQHSTVFLNAPAGSFYYGDPGVPKSFTDDRLANVSPHVAFTVDPFGNGKTVFRVGGAVMYDNPALYTSQRNSSNPPYTNEIDITGTTNLANPWATYPGGNPFPIANPPQSTSPFPTNTLYILTPRHIQTPTVNQWTAGVEQDLGRGWNFTLSYLGNKNSHLWLGRALNPAVYIPGTWTGVGSCGALTISPGTGKACSSTSNSNVRTVLSLINPTQGQGYSPTMTQIDDGANSSYNGLLGAIQHRMSNNFSFLANYTWSHCISVGDSPGDIAGPTYENSANPRLDRANCGYDVRHIFNTTLVASSHFSSLHGWAGGFANGWEIAPLIRITSGLPLNVTSGIDNSLTGIGLDRPNLVSPTAVYTGTKITQKAAGNLAYLSKAAFSQNATGTFGNLGRNAFRGPNYYDLDAAINRSFPIHERLNFNLRIEAFNVFNHPNLSTFTTALNSGTFGNATASNDPRIFQIAGKFTF